MTMGYFDGTEVCNLIFMYALTKLAVKFKKENIGLYRGYSLAVLENFNGSEADQARKTRRYIPGDGPEDNKQDQLQSC